MTAIAAMTITPAAGSLRAFALGAAVCGVGGGVVLLAGLVPAELRSWAGLGLGAAVLVQALVAWLHARLAARGAHDHDARLAGMRLQALLGIGFVAKLAGLVLGTGVLYALGLKFEVLAAFALAFAAASLLCQLVTASVLARDLARRAAARAAARTSAPNP